MASIVRLVRRNLKEGEAGAVCRFGPDSGAPFGSPGAAQGPAAAAVAGTPRGAELLTSDEF